MRQHSQCQLPAKHNATPLEKTILIVEDDADIRFILKAIITSETNYRVVAVSDGLQALKVIKTVTPELLLLDHNLPYMDGLQLLEHLHSIQGLEHVPVLMMSANSFIFTEFAKRGLPCLHKPFDDISVLPATIDDLIKKAEVARHNAELRPITC